YPLCHSGPALRRLDRLTLLHDYAHRVVRLASSTASLAAGMDHPLQYTYFLPDLFQRWTVLQHRLAFIDRDDRRAFGRSCILFQYRAPATTCRHGDQRRRFHLVLCCTTGGLDGPFRRISFQDPIGGSSEVDACSLGAATAWLSGRGRTGGDSEIHR